MAIKIIKNTMVDPIEHTCPDCGSIFEFNYQDIQRREETSLGFLSNTITKRFVVCPVCKCECSMTKVVVSSKEEHND